MNLRGRVWWKSGEERREMCLEATRDIVVGVVGWEGVVAGVYYIHASICLKENLQIRYPPRSNALLVVREYPLRLESEEESDRYIGT